MAFFLNIFKSLYPKLSLFYYLYGQRIKNNFTINNYIAMTARNLIIIFFLSLASFSFAQNNDANIETTKHLIKQIKKYRYSNPDSLKLLIDSTKKYIDIIDDDVLKSKYFRIIAVQFYSKWELDSSYYYFKKSLDYSLNTDDNKLIAINTSNMGLILNQFDSLERAMQYIGKSIDLFTNIKGAEKELAKSYLDLSQAYSKEPNYLKSSLYAETSDSISLSIGDSTKLKYTRLSIGASYRQLNMPNEALHMYRSALQLNNIFTDNDISAYIYSNYTEFYCTEYYQLDSALKYSSLTIAACKRLGQEFLLPSVYINLCGVYSAEGEYEKVIEAVYPFINDRRLSIRASSHINIGHAMTYLNNDSAEYFLLKGIEISLENNFNSYLANGYNSLAKYNADRNNHKDAYEYRLKYNSIIDSLHKIEVSEGIKILKEKYIHRIKSKEKEFHEQTIKSNKIIINKQLTIITLLSIISVIFIITISILIYNRKKIKAQKYQIQEINNKLRINDKALLENNIKLRSRDKLKNMFISILSHDLKSPMHSANQLLHFIKEDDSLDEAKKAELLNTIIDSSDNILSLINSLLEWSRLQINDELNANETCLLKDVISKEVDNLKVYNTKNITVETNNNCDYEILANDQVLSTIIRNILSNAYKFSKPDDTISIWCELTSKHSIIHIKDNGLGMPQDIAENIFISKLSYQQIGTANEKGNGIGLKITKMLIDMIEANIEARSEVGKGTTVIIRIPIV